MSGSPLDGYAGVGKLFRVLASPVRVAIVDLLTGRECFVHELAEATGLTQPLVSQHLRVLRDAGLVRRTRRGRHAAYALRDEHVAHIVRDAITHSREERSREERRGIAMSTATEHRPHPGHEHTHGPDCGHAAVTHGEHTDFLHDGHAHHGHGDHVDECDLSGVHAVAEPHEHVHAEGCGHEAVGHGDHVDYVHDGHHHAPHAGHFDEH